jgi:hypothetical protein
MSNSNYIAITPSDTVPMTTPCGLIYVGVTGDIALIGNAADSAVTFKSVPAGWFKLPFAVSQVMATNTTATNLVGCPKTLTPFGL